MDFSIVKSYKSKKKVEPALNKVIIENKTQIRNNILLDMVNNIVNKSMTYLKGEMPDRRFVRMVFTEHRWGITGCVKHRVRRNDCRDILYHDVFVRVPKSSNFYRSSSIYYDLEEQENLTRLAEIIYRVTVHELQHLEDKLSNAWGLEPHRVFSIEYSNNRRPKHDTRPEEIRADKAMHEFELDEEIVEALSKDIEIYSKNA